MLLRRLCALDQIAEPVKAMGVDLGPMALFQAQRFLHQLFIVGDRGPTALVFGLFHGASIGDAKTACNA